MSYKVKLNIFEGPFDLLVYLIENAEMSIYDIRVSEITAQYLAHIERMKEQDVAVGAEFLVLAATLIELKSKMLLPRITVDGAVEEDPRADLTQKLLEYTRFRKLAAALEERMALAAMKLVKPGEDLQPYTGETDEYLKMDMDQFIAAFKAFLYKKQKNAELLMMQDRIAREKMSVATKKGLIRKLLRKAKDKYISFRQLLTIGGKYDKVVTFVSLLEMIKAGAARVRQKDNFSEIEVIFHGAEKKEAGGAAGGKEQAE